MISVSTGRRRDLRAESPPSRPPRREEVGRFDSLAKSPEAAPGQNIVYRTMMITYLRRPGISLILWICLAPGCERPPAPVASPVGDRPEEVASPGPRATPPADEGAAAPAGNGILSGRVVYRGKRPESTTMFVPEAGQLEAHTTIVDAKTGGLKNAVVWVEGVPARQAVEHLPTLVLDQENWTFVPHVLAVRVGQKVRFLNSDIANHNIHSLTQGSEFNVGFPSGVGMMYQFRRPTGARPVRLGCDIHDWMRAWVYVFEQDAFAVTDAEGHFRIEGVPAGRRRLVVHHADGNLETSRDILVKGGTETSVDLELEGAAPDQTR